MPKEKKSDNPKRKSTSSKKVKKSTQSQPTGSKATSQKNEKTMNILKTIGIWVAIFLVTLIVIDYAVQYLNYRASVAIVNGERIYKGDYIEQLEDTYGSTIVNQMIDEALIYQEAESLDVSISEDDIDAEIEELEQNYGGEEEFQNELDSRNISMNQLREQIETTLIVETILAEDIEITEDEKKEFFKEYKDVLFPEDEDPTYEEAEEKIEETLMDQKISQNVQVWLQELRDDSNIKNNVDDPKNMELLGITRAFISDLTSGE